MKENQLMNNNNKVEQGRQVLSQGRLVTVSKFSCPDLTLTLKVWQKERDMYDIMYCLYLLVFTELVCINMVGWLVLVVMAGLDIKWVGVKLRLCQLQYLL